MMAEAQTHSELTSEAPAAGARSWLQKWWVRLALLVLLLILAGLAIVWFSREDIAENVIDDALAANGLEASYDIASIGPNQQVIENLIVGDPAAPDLTVEQVVVDIDYTFGAPAIGRVQLVRPRLYGSFRDGVFSLGALDPVVFAENEEPTGLPALNLSILDGRARIDSDYGNIGAKLEGEGRLEDGFAGTLAITAPGLGIADCSAATATAYGDVTTDSGAPRFDGVVRTSGLRCSGANVQAADAQARLELSSDFSSLDAEMVLAAETLSYAEVAIAELTGPIDATINLTSANPTQAGGFAARHTLVAQNFTAMGLSTSDIELKGNVQGNHNAGSANWNLDVLGEGTQLDPAALAGLDGTISASQGSFVASLLEKLRSGLLYGIDGASFTATSTLRFNPDATSAIIPEARLKSDGGETVLALSRVSYNSRGGRVAGSFLTGGANLPQMNGRIEQVTGGNLSLRLAMAEYRSGDDAMEVPRFQLRRDPAGRISFNGIVRADGAIPGGAIRGLTLPVEGTWSKRGGLLAGARCTDVQVSALTYYDLALDARSVTLCPEGAAMVRYSDQFELAVSSNDLELGGELAGTVASISASGATVRYPGPFEIADISATIGEPGNAVRLFAATLQGSVAEGLSGSFDGGSAALDAVPLDLSVLSGNWSYQDSVLRVEEGQFTLTDRTGPGFAEAQRFWPLRSQGSVLTLENNQIAASTTLSHPESGTRIADVTIAHDLTTGAGNADIDVPGVRFDENFQPEDLSDLARGVVAFADGTVTGEGDVSWTSETIDSSGKFSTTGFDFAAAFGPVRGVSGEIEFVDLVNLTTKPDQVIEIGSVNPGIEALGGRIVYSMTGGEIIDVKDGRWPFMGGELILRPVTFTYGTSSGQSYIFEMVGVDAATFVAQMEMTNISATGTFDGTIPIYFDADGNGSIEGGLLISRPPGGNVSYVGELSYEDLGAMGNYAFQMLRSLDYRQMSVELNGRLAGEILTNFQIDGVRQGEGASQNFITREVSKLPVRFVINVRSDNFFTLAKIARGLFDPSVFADDFDRELLGVEVIERVPVEPSTPAPGPSTAPEQPVRRDESPVQPSESDNLP